VVREGAEPFLKFSKYTLFPEKNNKIKLPDRTIKIFNQRPLDEFLRRSVIITWGIVNLMVIPDYEELRQLIGSAALPVRMFTDGTISGARIYEGDASEELEITEASYVGWKAKDSSGIKPQHPSDRSHLYFLQTRLTKQTVVDHINRRTRNFPNIRTSYEDWGKGFYSNKVTLVDHEPTQP
jgi:hypothetical protein